MAALLARPRPEVAVSSSLEGNAGTGRGLDDAGPYAHIQQTERFAELRRKQRSIVFPLTLLFLGWYFLYVLLADYAHDFMSTKVVGNITVGLVMGLLQFASTFVITAVYVRYANKHLDPVAEDIRSDFEGSRR
jgi:uncharacterized membrane protein (DUF485 family)